MIGLLIKQSNSLKRLLQRSVVLIVSHPERDQMYCSYSRIGIAKYSVKVFHISSGFGQMFRGI